MDVRKNDVPIVISGLTKTFGTLTALDSIDLEIRRGELFGLLGPNGAGKTTLLSILSTILPASSGKAVVCGFDVGRKRSEVRRSIGIVFQDPSLDDELTGEENLDFHGRLYGMSRERRRERIRKTLKLVDLYDRREGIVKTYSGGMRRRLELARGLMHEPLVLFLDEPTLGLDPQTRRKVWAYIRELNETHGLTLILTTHYMDEAEQLCSRVAIIDQGRIVALDTPAALMASLGGDTLNLVVSTASEVFIHSLRKLEEVRSVVCEANRLRVRAAVGESVLPRIFALAQSLGVHITELSTRKSNLEDVFLAVTGRHMRDEPITRPTDRIRLMRRSGKR